MVGSLNGRIDCVRQQLRVFVVRVRDAVRGSYQSVEGIRGLYLKGKGTEPRLCSNLVHILSGRSPVPC